MHLLKLLLHLLPNLIKGKTVGLDPVAMMVFAAAIFSTEPSGLAMLMCVLSKKEPVP